MSVIPIKGTMSFVNGKTVIEFEADANPVPTPTPVPTPSPTPAPTQPPGNYTELPLGAQNASLFKTLNQGEVYAMRLPFPFTADFTFNVGQGAGLTPTFIKMGISEFPGNLGDVSGDPNAGVSISASLNPPVDRGGNYQKVKVTNDRQYWVSFACPNGGGSVSHNWN